MSPSFLAIDGEKILAVVVWIVFVFWVIYTLVAAYHWLRYGHHSVIAVPAIIVHIVVSLTIAAYAVSGFK